MKKSIIIFCTFLATLGLLAFGYVNWNESETDHAEVSCIKTEIIDFDIPNSLVKPVTPDPFCDVSTRFVYTITKEKLHRAKSIIDILPAKETESIGSYQSVLVSVLDGEKETSVQGEGDVLNPAQVQLLQSTDYSTNFYIRADYMDKGASCKRKDDHLIYYITIVPEKEAEYTGGHDNLIEYLTENSAVVTAKLDEDQLKSGKIIFTVSKHGTITSVKLASSSGYVSYDNTMLGLIATMPGKWAPATNSKGEKVEQELVCSFGQMGC